MYNSTRLNTLGGRNAMLGDNIRFLRKSYNLTIKELAENLGSNYGRFVKVESYHNIWYNILKAPQC